MVLAGSSIYLRDRLLNKSTRAKLIPIEQLIDELALLTSAPQPVNTGTSVISRDIERPYLTNLKIP
jgi:hypothetical protein